MICQRISKSNSMAPKYKMGQKVVITPLKNQYLSPRDSGLEPYAGQVGKVTDYHWIRPNTTNGVFYIYTVRIGTGHKEVVLHEDELAACSE